MMNILYSPSTIFEGIAPFIVKVCVALIAKPFAHVTLPKLWSTHDSPASTLNTASTMNESDKSRVPSLITSTSIGIMSPEFA